MRHLALTIAVVGLSLGLGGRLGEASAQDYGLDTLEPIGPYLDGVFFPRAPDGNGGAEPPALLSQTGAFEDLETLTPRAGLIPYGVNSPLWTDGSVKRRWIAVPNDGVADSEAERIQFAAEDSWSFPAGTVFVKQFDLPVDARDPTRIRKVETRFMVRASDGSIYGVTYQWREDGSDADLLTNGASEEIEVTSANGTVGRQTWSFPSREDCASCHNPSVGYVLGVRTHQVNGDYTYPKTGRRDNQLRTWNHLGLFTSALDEAAIPGYLKSVRIDDTTASLEHRVRSYLDANCSSCHRPGYLAAAFDTRLTTPLSEQALVDGLVFYELGVPNARVIAPGSIERSLLHRRMSALGLHQMPPIGRNLVDAEAVSVLSEWILSLETDTGDENRSPLAQDDEASTIAGVPVEIPVLANDTDLDEDPLSLETWTSPANGTLAVLESGFVRYTPAAGFTGSDTFSYVVNDGRGASSNQATVRIQVFSGTNESAILFLDRSSRLVDPSSRSRICMAVADMDQDGLDDIVHLHDGLELHVDYQEPNGADFSGHYLDDFGGQVQLGVCVADADGNGYPDILHGGYYDGLYLHWNNGGRFSYDRIRLTNPRVFLQAVNFADISGDGLLDIFACHDLGDNAKFRNAGSRQFVYDNGLLDTRTTPVSDNSGNYGSVWTDYDGDGDLDLYLSKCRSGVTSSSDPRRVNMFFRNEGNGSYTNVAAQLGMDFGQQSWAADFGDIDNDGDLDCFVGNHGSRSLLMRNNGDGTFSDRTNASGIDYNQRVMQNVFRDFNNDGWLDLLVTGDPHALWLNDRDGTFTEADNPFTSSSVQSCAVGDLNHDGFTDVYAGYARIYESQRGVKPDKLFLASPNGNGFLSVTLKGVVSNRSAVGARMELHGSWGIQVREVRGGESYGIGHSFTQIFGLGNAASVDKLVVRWLSGTIDEIFQPEPNQFLALSEGSAALPVLANPGLQVNEVGDSVRLVLEAEDPTGDTLRYESVNLPAGLEIDGQSGIISGTLANEAAGSSSVVVSVSDSWGTVSQAFAWDVRLPEAAPAVVLSTEASTVSGAFQVTARFTRPVTGLTLSRFVVTNGVASAFTGSGATYRCTVTPAEAGEVTVRLPENAAFDGRGQGNLTSNTLPVVYRAPAVAPRITRFTATPQTVLLGEGSLLAWTVEDGGAPLTALEIDPFVGSVLGENEFPVQPGGTTAYTLTAENEAGVATASVTVTVDQSAPIEDSLSNLVAPGSVAHGDAARVSVDYASTGDRELWVWLQDSNDGWRTAAQGQVNVGAASGTHTFDLTIDGGARVGDGYVWAVRLLPPGWSTAADALAEQYSLADVQRGVLPPQTDALGDLVLPEEVLSPSQVTLEVPYQATERREIRIFLHDSEDNWFTIAQGNATVEPGAGVHEFQLPVLSQAREGGGYVWAVRLLPLGWTVADDALDADYGNASVRRNAGGPAAQDLLTSVEAPGGVKPTEVVTVRVEYEATERRDLGIWLHDSTDNWRTIGHGMIKVEPGIGTQSFAIGIVGDARLGSGYIWAVRLLPEGWATADDALDAFYKDASVNERVGSDLVNLAVLPAATATQSSVYGSIFEAALARDGNTDGDWRNGSVTHTELEIDPWWEIDLGGMHTVDHLLVWNRTDCCVERLASYHVFISEAPFATADAGALMNDPGVIHYTFAEAPLPTQRVDVGLEARYVRVQLAGADYLSLAEVEVYGAYEGERINGLTYSYYEGTWTELPDFESLSPLRTGTLSNFDLTPRRRDDFFALRYRGCFVIPVAGEYTFTLVADEGSQLDLDGSLLVDQDGTAGERAASVTLTEGRHAFELRYFDSSGDERLEVYWEGPGIARQRIPDAAMALNEDDRSVGFHHVGRQVPSNDNADGDLLDLTAEYALGRNPHLASMKDVGLEFETEGVGAAGLTIVYDRPANHAEIDYDLEVSSDLLTWTEIPVPDALENVSYGWERVRYEGMAARPGVGPERGFARLRIRHHAWNHETTTPILGWYATTFGGGFQTHGVSLKAAPVHASWVAQVDVERGLLHLAAGGLNDLDSAGNYYVELRDGPYEGHRWEIDLDRSTDQSLALNRLSPLNTLGVLPDTGLRLSQVVIQRHRTLGEVYPVTGFHGARDPASADQLQFFNGKSYEGYFLLSGGERHGWTSIGDADLADKRGAIIPPGTGIFVKRSAAEGEMTLVVTGYVRERGFVQRLHPGYNFLASATPLTMSPESRDLRVAHGLIGDSDPARADQIQFWLGDENDGAPGYEGYFLLDTGGLEGGYWTGIQDAQLTNEDATLLFRGDRGFFFRSGDGVSYGRVYRVPGPEIERDR